MRRGDLNIEPLLFLSLPQGVALIEVVLAVIAVGLMVYLTLKPRARDRQLLVLRVVGILVLISLLLGGLQYLI